MYFYDINNFYIATGRHLYVETELMNHPNIFILLPHFILLIHYDFSLKVVTWEVSNFVGTKENSSTMNDSRIKLFSKDGIAKTG
jgi:hypothetical protein